MNAAQNRLLAALELHRAQRLVEAEREYRAILEVDPDHFDAMHLLGALLTDQGAPRLAIPFLQTALTLKPGSSAAHYNLGLAHHRVGEFSAAIAWFDRAIRLQPAYPAAWLAKGTALAARDDLAPAVAAFDTALALRPGYVEALRNKGLVLLRDQHLAAAESALREALRLAPDDPATLVPLAETEIAAGRPDAALVTLATCLGTARPWDVGRLRAAALVALDRVDDALTAADEVMPLGSDDAHRLNARAALLASCHRPAAALLAADKALTIAPDLFEAHCNRGAILCDLGQFPAALAALERALELGPHHFRAHNNLGLYYLAVGLNERALDCFGVALELQPRFVPARANLGSTLMRLRRYPEALAVYRELGPADPVRDPWFEDYVHACQLVCDWSSYAEQRSGLLSRATTTTSTMEPFILIALDASHEQLRDAARRICGRLDFDSPRALLHSRDRSGRRHRIGYLSRDLNSHPVGLCMAEVIESHDPGRFEVHAFTWDHDDQSDARRRIHRAVEHVHDIRLLAPEHAAQLITDLQVDVLVDLMGHTGGRRPQILAHRPAPVQVNYLGYPGTLGAPFVDYMLADRTVLTPQQRRACDENVVWLPHAYLPGDWHLAVDEATPSRRELGLPEHGFVYCCFSAHYKITPRMFDAWMAILRQSGESVLWLAGGSPLAQVNLRGAAEKRGVDPARLVFAQRATKLSEHLARHRPADVFLDTVPYNAHSTARDALWVGLPVLTVLGDSFAGRVAASLLRASSLPELVASSLEDYVEIAVQLARQPERLSDIRSRLAAGRATCPLFDGKRQCRYLEAAFEQMIAIHRAGDAPRDFSILPGIAGATRA